MPRQYDSQKRVLVTGGAGFIGSHLVDRLARRSVEWSPVTSLEQALTQTIDCFRATAAKAM